MTFRTISVQTKIGNLIHNSSGKSLRYRIIISMCIQMLSALYNTVAPHCNAPPWSANQRDQSRLKIFRLSEKNVIHT